MEEEYEYSAQIILVGIVVGLVVTILTILTIGITGGFDKTYEKLDISEDDLARYHVIKYYPEYENCSITYESIRQSGLRMEYGAKIYCNLTDNRDGMKVNRGIEPTIELIFEDITMDEILRNIVSEKI